MGLAAPSELRLQRHAKAGLLLHHHIVNGLVLFEQLCLNNLNSGLQAKILVSQVVGGDLLLHDVVVEALSLLVDDPRPHLVHVKADLAGGLRRQIRLLRCLRGRHYIQSQLLAEVHVGFAPGCAWPALAGHLLGMALVGSYALRIVDKTIGEHLVAVARSHGRMNGPLV